MIVFLVGMSGSGKTTIGSMVSEKLGMTWIDSDTEIENEHQCKIATIFKDQGEQVFRKFESDWLESFLQNIQTDCIVSTGGGLPIYGNLMAKMLSSGLVIYLKVPVFILADRILNSQINRPLLENILDKESLIEKISNALKVREEIYAKARITIDSKDNPIETSNLIISKIQAFKLSV